MNKIYSIFGARKSKSGKYYNITIVSGKDDKKKYATIAMPIDNHLKSKIMISTDKKSLMIIVPLLDVPKEEVKEKVEENDSDLPF